MNTYHHFITFLKHEGVYKEFVIRLKKCHNVSIKRFCSFKLPIYKEELFERAFPWEIDNCLKWGGIAQRWRSYIKNR